MSSAAEWLTERLGGHAGSARCPAHEDKRPSLSIRDGDKGVLLKCHAGCNTAAVINALKRRGWWPVPGELSGHHDNRTDTSAWALEIWREARPIAGTIAEIYLRHRGITTTLPPSLRYHRGLKHKGTGLVMPTLLAGICGADRHVVAVQRTFLRADGRGKAPVSEPKMSLGAMGRGAVRLAPAAETIGLAEGVETGLSVQQLFNIATWCSLGAERLGKLELPDVVKNVVIFGDSGSEGAALKARDVYRRQGRAIEVRFPSVLKDFNDELRAGRSVA